MNRRKYIIGAAIGAFVAACDAVLSVLLLKKLGVILVRLGEDTLGEIFSALGEADIVVSPWIFLLTALAVGGGALLSVRKNRGVGIAVIILACLAGLCGTLLCTRVNGVPVYMAIKVVLDITASGIL